MHSIIRLFFLGAFVSVYSSVPTQFEQALQAHNQEKEQEALDLYCSLPTQTFNSMFNSGIIQYRQGSFAKALASWRLASLHIHMFNAWYALDKVYSAIAQLKDEHHLPVEWAGHPADGTGVWAHLYFLIIWYAHVLPLWLVEFLSILIGILTAFCVHALVRRRMRYAVGVSCVLCMAILYALAMHTLYIRTALYAVVEKQVTLRCGPGDYFEPIAELHPLVELSIEKKMGQWCKVRYQHAVGWVPVEKLYVIDQQALCGVRIVNWSENH